MNTINLRDTLLGAISIGVVILLLLGLFGQLVAPPNQEPDVVFADGVANCSKGTYNKLTTGTAAGLCATTVFDADNNTSEYKCDDGEGNSVTVDCTKNGGKGDCSSTGKGKCGEFKPD